MNFAERVALWAVVLVTIVKIIAASIHETSSAQIRQDISTLQTAVAEK